MATSRINPLAGNYTPKTVFQHPNGLLESNLTGKELIENFEKHHKLFKAHYNPEWYRLRMMEISAAISPKKTGTDVAVVRKKVARMVDGADNKKVGKATNKDIIFFIGRQKKKPLTVKIRNGSDKSVNWKSMNADQIKAMQATDKAKGEAKPQTTTKAKSTTAKKPAPRKRGK